MNNHPNRPPPPPTIPPLLTMDPSLLQLIIQWQATHQPLINQNQQPLPPFLFPLQNAPTTSLVIPSGPTVHPILPRMRVLAENQSTAPVVDSKTEIPRPSEKERSTLKTLKNSVRTQEAVNETFVSPKKEIQIGEQSIAGSPVTVPPVDTKTVSAPNRSKKSNKRKYVRKSNAATEKKVRVTTDPPIDVLAIIKKVKASIKEEKAKQAQVLKEIKQQNKFQDPFVVPLSHSYQYMTISELLVKKNQATNNCKRFFKYAGQIPFHEQQNFIFETLRDKKILIDLEKELRRREEQKNKPSSSSQSSPPIPEEILTESTMFPDYVYESFDVGFLQDLSDRVNIKNFNECYSNYEAEHSENLTLWYPRLLIIRKELKKVLDKKRRLLEKFSNTNRASKSIQYPMKRKHKKLILPIPDTGMQINECNDWGEDICTLLTALRSISGINFKPFNVKEIKQLEWVVSAIREMISPKAAMEYLHTVLERFSAFFKPSSDYVHGKTEISTREIFEVAKVDYKFHRGQGNVPNIPDPDSITEVSIEEADISNKFSQDVQDSLKKHQQLPSVIINNAKKSKAPKSRKKKTGGKSSVETKESGKVPNDGDEEKEQSASSLSSLGMNKVRTDIKTMSEERLSVMYTKVREALQKLDLAREKISESDLKSNIGVQFLRKYESLNSVFIQLNLERKRRISLARKKRKLLEKRENIKKRFTDRMKRLFSDASVLTESQRHRCKERLLLKASRDKYILRFLWGLIPKIEKECQPPSPTMEVPSHRFTGLEFLPIEFKVDALRRIAEFQKFSYDQDVSECIAELNRVQITSETKNLEKEKLRMISNEYSEMSSDLVVKVREVSRKWELQRKLHPKMANQDSTKAKKSVKRLEEAPDLLPSDVVFDFVGSRLTSGTEHKKYAVTVDEMLRRIGGYEKINSSNLAVNLRRAKTKNGGDLMRSQLQDKGVNLALNRRMTIRITKIVCLNELEMDGIFKDIKHICSDYPVYEIADKVVGSFIDNDRSRVLSLGQQCDDFLEILTTLEYVFGSVFPPFTGYMPIATKDKEFNRAMETFSHATHGFGILSLPFWTQKIIEIVDSMAVHNRLHDRLGNRLTTVPQLEHALEMSKKYKASAIVEYVEARMRSEGVVRNPYKEAPRRTFKNRKPRK